MFVGELILVHQYKNNGYNIIMDVNSGSIHVVDDLVYDMVMILNEHEPYKVLRTVIKEDETKAASFDEVEKHFKGLPDDYNEALIREAYGEISELIEADMLFSEDTYKDFVIDFKKRKTVVKALCLHISHDCNLSCRYCFAQ